jgi:type IV secretion system protein VirB10
MADDQTPSDNPFDTNGNAGPILDAADDALPQGAPNVAAKAGKTFFVLGIVILALLFLLYNIFSGGKKEEVATEPQSIKVVPKSLEPPPLPVVEPEPVVAPPPTIVPPSIPAPLDVPVVNINPLTPKDDSAAKAQEMARLRSAMMLKEESGGGVGGLLGGGSTPAPTSANTDPNSQFAAAAANTKTVTVEATRIGDLRRTIAQGRIIQATMESALNTDLPAPIRAIVSRDTYGEAGTIPLIPKGSRLIGSYNTTLASGQTRVFVIWTRVIRPDGVDVDLDSPLVDGIGQAGVSGQIDSKFQQIFARSLVSSVMNIAVAIGSDEISGGSTTTTNSTTGSQTSGDAASTATTNALNRLGSITDGFIQKFLNVQPTILIDQGTPVNVFVNKDIIFPADIGGVRIVN